MTYYIRIKNNEIISTGECHDVSEGVTNIETTKEIYDILEVAPEKYIFKDNQIVENPEYESIVKKREVEQQKLEILTKLEEIDSKRIRAICENEVKNPDTGETWLDYYNSQVLDLRDKLTKLNID
ncbi:hypothetical protein IJ579_00970 [bacterium]|nr:hypothetical protein [bacterium]